MRELQRRTFQFPLLLGKFFILFWAGVYTTVPVFMLRMGYYDALLPYEAAASVPISAMLIGWSLWHIGKLVQST